MNVTAYQPSASSNSAKTVRNGKTIKYSSVQSEDKRGTMDTAASDMELTLEELKEQKRKQEKEEKDREKEDALQKKLEEMTAQKRAFQKMMRKKNHISYGATADMSALTSAANVGQVKSIAARLYLKANRLKLDAKNSKTAAAALAVVKNVLKKAENKIGRLQDEEVLIAQQKRAERKQELEYAERVKRELEKRRKIRTAEEQNDMAECLGGSSNYHYTAPLDMISLPSPIPVTDVPITAEGSGTAGGMTAGDTGAAGASVNVVI